MAVLNHLVCIANVCFQLPEKKAEHRSRKRKADACDTNSQGEWNLRGNQSQVGQRNEL